MERTRRHSDLNRAGQAAQRPAGRAAKAVRLLAIAGVLVVSVTACSDRALDTGVISSFMGARSVADTTTTPVRRIGDGDRPYPNLASVPPRPTDLRTDADRQADREALKRDRDSAKTHLPNVMDVPPAPVLRPGIPSS